MTNRLTIVIRLATEEQQEIGFRVQFLFSTHDWYGSKFSCNFGNLFIVAAFSWLILKHGLKWFYISLFHSYADAIHLMSKRKLLSYFPHSKRYVRLPSQTVPKGKMKEFIYLFITFLVNIQECYALSFYIDLLFLIDKIQTYRIFIKLGDIDDNF